MTIDRGEGPIMSEEETIRERKNTSEQKMSEENVRAEKMSEQQMSAEKISEQKQLVQEQFGRVARAYVDSAMHNNQTALEAVVAAVDPHADWLVLDVATGGGHVAKALAGMVKHVVASDLTPRMLAEARSHIRDVSGIDNVSYVTADAEQLPFLSDTFDAVTCRIAPHHFPNPRQFVQEVARVLKPGGRFVLVDNIVPEDGALAAWYNTVEHLRDRSHIRCAPATQWQEWIAAAGLVFERGQASWKKFEFESWALRMVTSEQQYREVLEYIQSAPKAAADYFQVEFVEGKVLSFQGLEWLAVSHKP